MAVLTQTITITTLALVFILLFITIAVFQKAAGGTYLDMLISRLESQALVDRLTPSQVKVHIRVTVLLDTLLPACYGLLFAALTLRFSGMECAWMTIPAILAVSADYLENWSHVTALQTKRVPGTKPIFSAAKWTFIGLAFVVVIYAWYVQPAEPTAILLESPIREISPGLANTDLIADGH